MKSFWACNENGRLMSFSLAELLVAFQKFAVSWTDHCKLVFTLALNHNAKANKRNTLKCYSQLPIHMSLTMRSEKMTVNQLVKKVRDLSRT
jgi:hypothetical protein